MAKTKNKNITLSGRNIYQDKNGRNIYYDYLTKKFMYINKEDENKFFIYKNRFAIIILLVALTYDILFKQNQLYAFIGALILEISFEIYYRTRIFSKLKQAKNMEKRKRISPITSIIQNKNKPKIISLIVLYLLFAILLTINTQIENYSLGITLISYLLAIGALYFSILHLIAFIKLKKD